MKRFVVTLILVVLLVLAANGQTAGTIQPPPKLVSLQNAQTGNANGTLLTTRVYGAALVSVSGTFSGTVNFEASLDGTTWRSVLAFNLATGVEATTATGAGTWFISLPGLEQFRARTSGMVSGSVTITGRPVPTSAASIPSPGGGGGGGIASTIDIGSALPAGGNQIGTVGLVAGNANVGDVDVASVPADPFGTNADAASATGSVSAKLRFIASTGIPITGTVTVGSHEVTNAGTFAVQATSVPADPFGANADAASATGSISAKLRFIASTGIPITGTVTVGSHAVTNAGTFAVQATSVPTDPFGANADAASATGSISAKLRFIAATGIPITGTATVAGGKTNNNAAPGATNVGVLGAIANASPPSWTEGNQVALSTNLAGALRVDLATKLDSTNDSVAALGNVAHDAVDSGNPVKIGARATNASIAAVANNDRSDLITDLNGRLITAPYSVPENLVSGVTAAITGTSDTSVIAAAGAGVRNYVTSLSIINSHATVSTVVELKDGSTVIWRGYSAAAGGGFTITFPNPLRGTANTAINCAAVTTGANVYCSAAGYKAP